MGAKANRCLRFPIIYVGRILTDQHMRDGIIAFQIKVDALDGIMKQLISDGTEIILAVIRMVQTCPIISSSIQINLRTVRKILQLFGNGFFPFPSGPKSGKTDFVKHGMRIGIHMVSGRFLAYLSQKIFLVIFWITGKRFQPGKCILVFMIPIMCTLTVLRIKNDRIDARHFQAIHCFLHTIFPKAFRRYGQPYKKRQIYHRSF